MDSKGRILVVDDEANARTALVELLREEGYSVESAADGFKALPKLDDFAPDLLLTDLADRAFGGSAAKLVMQALSGRKATAEELGAIREFLETLEGEAR